VNASRLVQLTAVTVVAFACAIVPHTRSQGSGWIASAVAAQQRNAGRARQLDPVCPSLVDGRGGQVQGSGAPASVGTAFAKNCPGTGTRLTPDALTVQVVERGAAVAGLRVDAAWMQNRAGDSQQWLGIDAQRLSATVLTSGVVIWLLHSSFWGSLLILGLPLWRHVDLLPIVERTGDAATATLTGASDLREEMALNAVLDAPDVLDGSGDSGSSGAGPA